MADERLVISERDREVAAKFLDCKPEAAVHLARLLAAARAEGDKAGFDRAVRVWLGWPRRRK